MGKYCCFFCPEGDYRERELTDTCPNCGKTYGFPLTNMPSELNGYKITKSLGRGFYGAAYAAIGKFNKPFVIKISPKSFYDFKEFKKTPFEKECQDHVDVAAQADHAVGFFDGFDWDVTFSDEDDSLPCHVMVLDYVNGELLNKYITGKVSVTILQICQITIDLLTIINQFRINHVNHNDLHAENLIVENLRPSKRRFDALCGDIKVMAIDLGSISDQSKSSDTRSGDLRFAIEHIGQLLNKLVSRPDDMADKDYRIALKLQNLIYSMSANPQHLRLDAIPDYIAEVRAVYSNASRPFRPWGEPMTLSTFSDHMNAQTLESWFVPNLLVDPDNRWLSKITIGGPQIITGMRGCGKTMLLRALDIHARINQFKDDSSEDIINRIKKDNYVGLFVSAQKLLDLKQHSLLNIEFRLTRLFINYALEAVRALLHIQDLDLDLLTIDAHRKLGGVISGYLNGAGALRDVLTLDDLERQLTAILVKTNNDTRSFSIQAAPSDSFPSLANAIRECSELFTSAKVFYLLDDVSTRYHDVDRIGELVTNLLFQMPNCAFKFTSEWQTIELGLKSPGKEHPIRVGRDIDIFDLGADVHETIKGTDRKGLTGAKFVASVLEKRSSYEQSHPLHITPSSLLGNVSLKQIAIEISSSASTSNKRKNAYRGISCLSKMCVGDIGDVIKVYDEIARHYKPSGKLPIRAEVQSLCFRDMSSNRLYDLNRREGHFKDHAIAFAEASHELMKRSYKKGTKEGQANPRIRSYTSIYVRITTDDKHRAKQQIDLLREMIDASVFVYTGAGSGRTKTKDANPTMQFILGFRKIYGLSSYIGLSDRDRFELSGDDLSEWLEHPEKAKEILIRNQTEEDISPYIDDSESDEGFADEDKSDDQAEVDILGQRQLFEGIEVSDDAPITIHEIPKMKIKINQLDITQLKGMPVDSVLTSLGFEDRALEANKILALNLSPSNVFGVEYSLKGHSEEITQIWNQAGRNIEKVTTPSEFGEKGVAGLSLIDISGLTKPFIFKAIHKELVQKGRVLVSYASAKKYYPLQEDLDKLLASRGNGDDFAFLEGLADILIGEEGPYEPVGLISARQADPSRGRALLAFAPTKHQRLFSLLDNRDYDWVELLAPDGDSPRDQVSKFAAEFIKKNQQNANVSEIDTRNLLNLLDSMNEKYMNIFDGSGFNVEVGLTGSKFEAVASAILAAQRKVSEVWYLKPDKFDSARFSVGFKEMSFYEICIDE